MDAKDFSKKVRSHFADLLLAGARRIPGRRLEAKRGRLYEPFGITILEAMSMRKPVVATRVGGIPEIITNEVEGLLVEPGNSLQLAKAISRMFSDSSERRRFGSNARKRVEKEFTWETIARKTFEFYSNLLNDMRDRGKRIGDKK